MDQEAGACVRVLVTGERCLGGQCRQFRHTFRQVEGGKELAADSTNMRTAHPKLSNLEEGTYTFILKVGIESRL